MTVATNTVDRKFQALMRRVQLIACIFALLALACGVVVFVAYGAEQRWVALSLLAFSLPFAGAMEVARRPLPLSSRKRLSVGLSVAIVIAYAVPAVFSGWGPPMQAAEMSVFRPIYGFTPFVYVGLVLLDPTVGVRRCWLFFVLQAGLVLSGLAWHTGFDLERDGAVGLVLWLFVGNTLFIILLRSAANFSLEMHEFGREAAMAEALRAREQKLELVLTSIQAGAWGWEFAGGSVSRWSTPRFRELLGYDTDHEPYQGDFLDRVHPEDRKAYGTAIAEQLQSGALFDGTGRLQMADGSYRWFNVRGHVTRASDGTIENVVGAILDVHEQVTAQQALADSHAQLEDLAYRDPLTGISNRRYFMQQFEHELHRAEREREPLSLLIADIDHFKPYNDHYGHSAGDEALKTAAHLLAEGIHRHVDVAARIGGEEFALLLQNTNALGALHVAKRLCKQLRDQAIPHARAPLGCLTVSIGVTTFDGGTDDWTSTGLMMEEADAALYMLKSSTRDDARHYLEWVNAEPDNGSAASAEPDAS